jgi:glyoxylase-like metal-dependent hydrolase (beta-lactamase superfamily II)
MLNTVKRRAGSIVALFVFMTVGPGCSIRDRVMRREIGNLSSYYLPDDAARGASLARVGAHVWTFQYKWRRNIVIDTRDGLVVVDSFSREAALALSRLLAADPDLGGKSVHTLIYSHYHTDSTGGGAVLAPKVVIAHERCPDYWRDCPDHDVLKPTRLISGDQELTVGEVTIQLLQCGMSHTDTLYAVLVPEDRVLFTVELGFVRTVPPPTVTAMAYTPAFGRDLERLSQLRFDVWVPSGWGYGTKDDLLEFREFFETTFRLCRQAERRHRDGFEREDLEAIFDEVYLPLKERYESWRGFSEAGPFFISWATQMTMLGG